MVEWLIDLEDNDRFWDFQILEDDTTNVLLQIPPLFSCYWFKSWLMFGDIIQ